MIDFKDFVKNSSKTKMSDKQKTEYIQQIYATGTELEKSSLAYDWIHTWSRPEQVPYFFTDISSWDEWWYIGGRGIGKLIGVSFPILTANRNWIKYGDLIPGDIIFDEQGKPTKVLAIYPKKATKILKYYRLTFNDGSFLDACGEHLWATWEYKNRKQYLRQDTKLNLLNPKPEDYPTNWATYKHRNFEIQSKTTSQLLSTLKTSKREDANHSIPLCKPCQLPDQDLLIDPYVLGNWLANGNSNIIYCNSEDTEHLKSQFCSYYKCWSQNQKGKADSIHLKQFIIHLKQLNLIKNKHIPNQYLIGSINQRIKFLQGFIDGDGCFEQGNLAVLYNTNEQIIDGFKKILGSLGIKYTIRSKVGKIKGVSYKTCYALTFTSIDFNPFLNPRKANKWDEWRKTKTTQFFRQRARMIISIEPIEPIDMMCITVDSPSSLYLIGNECISTHNTKSGAELVRHLVFELFPRFPLRMGCITPIFADIEGVVALGDSGVMNCLAPWEKEKARFYSTARQIVFNEGEEYESQITFYSADNPDALRGKQWHFLWIDELASYPKPLEILDQIAFCLRLPLPNGVSAKKFVTMTPRPHQFLRDIVKEAKTDDRILITSGNTYDNIANLSPTIFRSIIKFEGTRWGQQEIYGEILSGDSAGIIKKSWIRKWPADEALPKLDYVFLSYDPAFTANTQNDPTGFVAIGIFKDIDEEYSVILLDAWEEFFAYPDLKVQVISDWENKYGEVPRQRRPNGSVVENKASGHALIPDLYRTNVKIIPFNPGKTQKLDRTHSISWFIKDGKFYVPESRMRRGEFVSWAEAFIEQLTNFPLVNHDDMIDALVQVLLLLLSGGLLEGAVTNRDDDDEDIDDDELIYKKKRSNPYAQ